MDARAVLEFAHERDDSADADGAIEDETEVDAAAEGDANTVNVGDTVATTDELAPALSE